MDKMIETVRLMADGQHPGVIGENARAELDKVARLLGECRDAMRSFVDLGEDHSNPEIIRHITWFEDLVA